MTIEFEKKDLSIGTARFSASKAISKNLSMKPAGRKGLPDSPMPHANVEVHFRNDRGIEVPMTRRLVRYWFMRPLPGATVDELNKWQVVGLQNFEFFPFAQSGGEPPAQLNFEWDRPGNKDAPGFQSVSSEAGGQLQEFIVGNKAAGGAYYQIYTLQDSRSTRIITTNALSFSVDEYLEVLRMIDSGEYPRSMSAKLLFMPAGGTSDITPLPRR
ncbi:hypothetical protein [Variovorax guangxiensis]|uniref:hypothetical protein n=1 Tax=Variovorax guangxiensis TaxID=1775474 RepID=UPI00286B3337|nr:hypothetical protein [Variovorax guangxiensis]